MAMIFCNECGKKHASTAKACPHCGHSAKAPANPIMSGEKSVVVYVLLAAFLGCWGAHKFYAGKMGQGVALLLMGTIGWALIIPGFVACIWAFVDFIIGLCNLNNPEKIFN